MIARKGSISLRIGTNPINSGHVVCAVSADIGITADLLGVVELGEVVWLGVFSEVCLDGVCLVCGGGIESALPKKRKSSRDNWRSSMRRYAPMVLDKKHWVK